MRKSSRAITLTLLASVSAVSLVACDDPQDVPEQVQMYSEDDLGACSAQFDAQTCIVGQSTARAAHERDAPKFTTREQCEAESGGACATASNGSGMFLPAMAGFLMGRALSGGGVTSQPLMYGRDPNCPPNSSPQNCARSGSGGGSRFVYVPNGGAYGSAGYVGSMPPAGSSVGRGGTISTAPRGGTVSVARGIAGVSAAGHAGGGS